MICTQWKTPLCLHLKKFKRVPVWCFIGIFACPIKRFHTAHEVVGRVWFSTWNIWWMFPKIRGDGRSTAKKNGDPTFTELDIHNNQQKSWGNYNAKFFNLKRVRDMLVHQCLISIIWFDHDKLKTLSEWIRPSECFFFLKTGVLLITTIIKLPTQRPRLVVILDAKVIYFLRSDEPAPLIFDENLARYHYILPEREVWNFFWLEVFLCRNVLKIGTQVAFVSYHISKTNFFFWKNIDFSLILSLLLKSRIADVEEFY